MREQERLPAHSQEIEESLISNIIMNPELVDTARFNRITSSSFYFNRNSLIFSTISSMRDNGDPIDLATVTDKLNSLGKLDEAGGASEITQMFSNYGTDISKGIDYYCDRLKNLEGLRLLNRNLYNCYQETFDINSDVGNITQRLVNITNEVTDSVTNSDIQKFDLDRASEPTPLGLKLKKYPYLMSIMGSLRKKELIMIGGRPSHGKSAFALDIQIDLSEQNIRSGLITIEQSNMEEEKRILSKICKIDLQRLMENKLTLQETKRKEALKAQINFNTDYIYMDDSCIYLPDIVYKARKMRFLGCEAILIDYAQLIEVQEKYGTRDIEIGVITRTLKRLSKELDVPVIALSQLLRDVDKRKDPTPRLSDFRESGNFEQDADVGLFVFRPDPINKPTEASLIVAKNRNGRIGKVTSYFEPSFITFFENEKGEYEKSKPNYN